MTQRITATVGRTYNAGNYESIRIDIGLELDIDDLDNAAAAGESLFIDALKQLNADAQYLGLKETRKNGN